MRDHNHRPKSADTPSTLIGVDECQKIVWDAVVVGTGIGGATIGYELARLGKRVLFLEKGPFVHATSEVAPESLKSAIVHSPQLAEAPAAMLDGRWPHKMNLRSNIGNMEFPVPVGCVSGGSSAFYAAAMERFLPCDFSPSVLPASASGSSLPKSWPVTYEEFEPYYCAAEQLYGVRGSVDPLNGTDMGSLLEPFPLNERDRVLMGTMEKSGLHPYRVHVACDYIPGCRECPGTPCLRGCKHDAAWACLIPALSRYGAYIMPNCSVKRLVASGSCVQESVCGMGDSEVRIRGRTFVLAAGGFATPVILLKSKSPSWPDGLGNQSGLVGRNLMFHGGDFFAIAPNRPGQTAGPQKALALNDLYTVGDQKLGTFQSLGVRLSVETIMQYLRDSSGYTTAWWRWLVKPTPVWWRKVTSPFVRAAAMTYFYLMNFKYAGVWVSIIEDYPYPENRVLPAGDDDDDIVVEYKYSEDLSSRVQQFRKHLMVAMRGLRVIVLSPRKKIDYAHVCGTCRFGDSPHNSVLDKSNRVHGVENLYVVDASFFPSSGGTNPSLTIAANALRVARLISGHELKVDGEVCDKQIGTAAP